MIRSSLFVFILQHEQESSTKLNTNKKQTEWIKKPWPQKAVQCQCQSKFTKTPSMVESRCKRLPKTPMNHFESDTHKKKVQKVLWTIIDTGNSSGPLFADILVMSNSKRHWMLTLLKKSCFFLETLSMFSRGKNKNQRNESVSKFSPGKKATSDSS